MIDEEFNFEPTPPLFEELNQEDGMEVASDPSDHDNLWQQAISNPEFDYFKEAQILEPKLEIGRYVLDQGFKVPLIEDLDDWKQAFDDNQAMIRSELEQDYDGLSGLLSSLRILKDQWSPVSTSNLQTLRNNLNQDFNQDNQPYYDQLKTLVLEGLRSGHLHSLDFMHEYQGYQNWSAQLYHLAELASSCSYRLNLDLFDCSTSLWRYIEGTNVRIFGDPNVEGRYHFGVLPSFEIDNMPAVGGYLVDRDQYDEPQYFRKHSQGFIARPYIELYEQIRHLALFDTTQAPVMEIVKDANDDLHFLQYLKTNLAYFPTEPFNLSNDQETLYLNNVRGATAQAGQSMKLFISPQHLKEGMRHQAIFYDATYYNKLAIQIASVYFADLVLQEAYISFQNNHFESSPLYRPSLAAGLDGASDKTDPKLLQHLQTIFNQERQRYWDEVAQKSVGYFDIVATANGREMAIESDWQLQEVNYADLG